MHQVDERSTLRGYVRVFRRRKWLLIQALVLVPVVAVLVSLRGERLYQASSQVLLLNQNLAEGLTGITQFSFYQDPLRIADTQVTVARVPQVAKRTLQAAGVTDETAAEFLGDSSVSADPSADVLDFRVKDPVPAQATQLATEYARQYTIYRQEIDKAALEQARRDIEARIANLVDVNPDLATTLAQKAKELQTLEALQTSHAVVLRQAQGASQVAPQPVRDGVLGVALGLIVGLMLVFLREALDTRVRSAQEIGEWLGLPLLGRLPKPPRRFRGTVVSPLSFDSAGPKGEAFRVLRTNFEFANLDRGAKTIMVTSATDGEGKSTTAANLAVALARSGRRVVLVDLDLRRPMLDQFFGLDGPGLTSVVLGHVELGDAVAEIAIPTAKAPRGTTARSGHAPIVGSLGVLPSGPIPPDPGEFVTSPALTETLARLRNDANVVLIDSPPLLHVGDALALTRDVDAVIVVTHLSLVRRPMLRELRRVLESTPVAKLGFVLTGAQRDEDSYYATYVPYQSFDHSEGRQEGSPSTHRGHG